MQIDGEPWMQPPCTVDTPSATAAVPLVAPHIGPFQSFSLNRRILAPFVFQIVITHKNQASMLMAPQAKSTGFFNYK